MSLVQGKWQSASVSEWEHYFLRDGGHFAEAEKKTDRAVAGHSVLYPAEIMLWKEGNYNNTPTCWMCVLQCHIIASWQVHICLLMSHFSNFTCWCLRFCHSVTAVFFTSGYWWHYTCLSSTKDDQCCATLPAAHSTHWQSRLVMMQCEVTDS